MPSRRTQATRATYSRSAPPDQSARSARRARPLKRTALLAKPVNGINAPQRPDCVAGVRGLEPPHQKQNAPWWSQPRAASRAAPGGDWNERLERTWRKPWLGPLLRHLGG